MIKYKIYEKEHIYTKQNVTMMCSNHGGRGNPHPLAPSILVKGHYFVTIDRWIGPGDPLLRKQGIPHAFFTKFPPLIPFSFSSLCPPLLLGGEEGLCHQVIGTGDLWHKSPPTAHLDCLFCGMCPHASVRSLLIWMSVCMICIWTAVVDLYGHRSSDPVVVHIVGNGWYCNWGRDTSFLPQETRVSGLPQNLWFSFRALRGRTRTPWLY